MNVSPAGSGDIRSDEWSVQPKNYPADMGSTKGIFPVTAIPKEGYEFVKWIVVEGPALDHPEFEQTISTRETVVRFEGVTMKLTAFFKEKVEPVPDPEPEPEPDPTPTPTPVPDDNGDTDIDVETGCFITTIR